MIAYREIVSLPGGTFAFAELTKDDQVWALNMLYAPSDVVVATVDDLAGPHLGSLYFDENRELQGAWWWWDGVRAAFWEGPSWGASFRCPTNPSSFPIGRTPAIDAWGFLPAEWKARVKTEVPWEPA